MEPLPSHEQDTFAALPLELERALRRARSTGDLSEPTRPSRHPSAVHRRSEGQAGPSNSWSPRHHSSRSSSGSSSNTRPARELRMPAPLSLSVGTIPETSTSSTSIPLLVRPPRPPEPAYHSGRGSIGGVGIGRNEPWVDHHQDHDHDHDLPDVPTEEMLNDEDRRATRPPPRGWLGKVLVFFGQAGPNARARSQLISVVWTLGSGVVQFVVIVTLLAYAAHHESPTKPGMTEWDACQRPLGVWNAIWVVREVMTCACAYWAWTRDRKVRIIQERRQVADAETTIEEVEFSRTRHGHGLASSSRRNRRRPTTQELLAQQPYTQLYNRLSVLTSALSLVWFLTAHILEYTSVNTCRKDAPHLWWLTFGILCILYFMILEIFLLGLLVFILGPVLLLIYTIILLCLGRPLRNPRELHPDVGKVPKTIVDSIPLVLYIPAPPDGNDSPNPTSEKDEKDGAKDHDKDGQEGEFEYPPKKPSSGGEGGGRRRRFRFAFFRLHKHTSKASKSVKDSSTGSKKPGQDKEGEGEEEEEEEPKTWEDRWVKGEYPFVRLEDNRAACAICLMDFEEPEKRARGGKGSKSAEGGNKEGTGTGDAEGELSTPQSGNGDGDGSGSVQEVRVQVDEMTTAERERMQLQLEDAGSGAQPLRLLGCGHVFHKTCLDPWLTDVSGRCPVCQRPVEVPGEKKEKKRRRRGGRRDENTEGARTP